MYLQLLKGHRFKTGALITAALYKYKAATK